MDADDTIPEECAKRLHDPVFLAEELVYGILMKVHIPPAEGDEGFTIVDHVKLFRNLPELRFEGRIHEQILDPISRAGGKIEGSGLHIVHSGYDHSPEGQKRKKARDMPLLLLDIEERPDHPFPRFNLGMSHFHWKEFAEAIPVFEESLRLSRPHESTVRKVYAMMGACHAELGRIERAKECFEEGLRLHPRDPELLFRAANAYRDMGNLPAAEQHYIWLLTAPETGHIDSLDVTMTGYKARHNLALIYSDMGRLPDAENQYRTALQLRPRFLPSMLGLTDVLMRQGRLPEVRALIEEVRESDPKIAQELINRVSALTPTP